MKQALHLLRRPHTLLLGTSLAITACHTTPNPIATEMKRLQGSWEGTGAGGRCSIRIAGNCLRYDAGTNWWKTTFTLSSGAEPQQLQATITASSPPGSGLGTTVFALFKIDDGVLTLAVDDGSDTAPADFDRASSRYVVTRVHAQ